MEKMNEHDLNAIVTAAEWLMEMSEEPHMSLYDLMSINRGASIDLEKVAKKLRGHIEQK